MVAIDDHHCIRSVGEGRLEKPLSRNVDRRAKRGLCIQGFPRPHGPVDTGLASRTGLSVDAEDLIG
jgi:hypothetical protein